MYKNTKRAERRHHYNRLKKRRIDRNYWGKYKDSSFPEWSKPHLGMAVDTACNCSCPMCGNPRRHFGEKTLSERSHDEKYKEESHHEEQ